MTSQPPTGSRSPVSTPASESPSSSHSSSQSHSSSHLASHLALGAEGEARAARYLESKGYRIVARNVRAGGVELDLVLRRGRTAVFVEVKTRRSLRFGPPELAVNANKRNRLRVGAAAWLREHGRRIDRARFDVIAWQVRGRGGAEEQWHCRHIENAFEGDE